MTAEVPMVHVHFVNRQCRMYRLSIPTLHIELKKYPCHMSVRVENRRLICLYPRGKKKRNVAVVDSINTRVALSILLVEGPKYGRIAWVVGNKSLSLFLCVWELFYMLKMTC